MRVIDIKFGEILLDEKNTKTFQFMTFHTKLLWVQYHCILDSPKEMDFLKFVMALYSWYYLVIVGMIKFVIELSIL